MAQTVPIAAIGVVRTNRTSLEDTPIQAALNRGEHGTIWIEPQYREGLELLAVDGTRVGLARRSAPALARLGSLRLCRLLYRLRGGGLRRGGMRPQPTVD